MTTLFRIPTPDQMQDAGYYQGKAAGQIGASLDNVLRFNDMTEEEFLDQLASWVEDLVEEKGSSIGTAGPLSYLLACLGLPDMAAVGVLRKLHAAYPALPITDVGGKAPSYLDMSDVDVINTDIRNAPDNVELGAQATIAAEAARTGRTLRQVALAQLRRAHAIYANAPMSAAERAICAATGVSEADFVRTKIRRAVTPARRALSSGELAICAATGVDPSDFLQTKRARREAGA